MMGSNPRPATKDRGAILTCEQHQDSGGGNVARGSSPTSGHSGPECDEYDEECYNQNDDYWTAHVCEVQRWSWLEY